jgi:hypothetical protein
VLKRKADELIAANEGVERGGVFMCLLTQMRFSLNNLDRAQGAGE